MNEEFWVASFNALRHLQSIRRDHPALKPRHDPGEDYVRNLGRQLAVNIAHAPEYHRAEFAAGRLSF